MVLPGENIRYRRRCPGELNLCRRAGFAS